MEKVLHYYDEEKGKEFFGRGTPFIRYTDVYNNRALRIKVSRDKIDLLDKTINELEDWAKGRALYSNKSNNKKNKIMAYGVFSRSFDFVAIKFFR